MEWRWNQNTLMTKISYVFRIQGSIRLILVILKENDLIVNNSKAEEFQISREEDYNWKKCTILGSLLDMEEDVSSVK